MLERNSNDELPAVSFTGTVERLLAAAKATGTTLTLEDAQTRAFALVGRACAALNRTPSAPSRGDPLAIGSRKTDEDPASVTSLTAALGMAIREANEANKTITLAEAQRDAFDRLARSVAEIAATLDRAPRWQKIAELARLVAAVAESEGLSPAEVCDRISQGGE
jgi:hypothetical protein